MHTEKQETRLICLQCGIPMEMGQTSFSYLGHTFTAEVPRCPRCGQVFLSEEMVSGKVHSVEISLEDK